jgi:hypothetical protein
MNVNSLSTETVKPVYIEKHGEFPSCPGGAWLFGRREEKNRLILGEPGRPGMVGRGNQGIKSW